MTAFPDPASFAAYASLTLFVSALALLALDSRHLPERTPDRDSRQWGLAALIAALAHAVEALSGLGVTELRSGSGPGAVPGLILLANLLLGASFIPLARGLATICRDGERLVGAALAANVVHVTVATATFGLLANPYGAATVSALVAGIGLAVGSTLVLHPQRPETIRYHQAIAAAWALAAVCGLTYAVLALLSPPEARHPMLPWLVLFGSAAIALLPFVHIVHCHRQLSAQIEQSALLDPLTALLNRRGLAQSWAMLEGRARRGDEAWHIGVLMLDIDDFKSINAAHGQATGDAVLQIAADTLRQTGRRYDVACRFDGEQFCMLLPGVTIRQAQRVTERIRERFTQQVVERIGVKASLSAGVTVIDASNSTLEQATDTADQMLHTAMHDGRDRTRIDPDAVRVIAGLKPLPQAGRRDQFGFPLI
jgi:diguanylate cyclase (GGDEF)-like protein